MCTFRKLKKLISDYWTEILLAIIVIIELNPGTSRFRKPDDTVQAVFTLIGPGEFHKGVCKVVPLSEIMELHSLHIDYLFFNTMLVHNLSMMTSAHVGYTACMFAMFNATDELEVFYNPSIIPLKEETKGIHLQNIPFCEVNPIWVYRRTEVEFTYSTGEGIRQSVTFHGEQAQLADTAIQILKQRFNCTN